MTVKTQNSLEIEPLMLHEKLHTTFHGLVHPISTEQAAVHQYLGIKYASVPARFRQSKLFTAFPSVTDATRHGPICPQTMMSSMGYEEELFGLTEDVVPRQPTPSQNEFECLNLNITCPAGTLLNSRLPVMLFIHGGGNRGSGSSWLYDGGAFVQKSILIGKPVILVTIDYRIGILGSAANIALREDNHAAGDEGVGNYGLRDQRKALEWVYSYISGFGGDPENITLFGSASGAADILCHMNSSANEKLPLFQRAIVQSPLMDIDIPNVSSAGWQLSKVMSSLHARSVEDLRRVPVERLVACASHVRTVDDGVFFAHGWREALYPEPEETRCLASHLIVPELQAISHRLLSPRRHQSRSRSCSRTRPQYHSHHQHEHPANKQPLMIGDCGAESLQWSLPASLWNGPGVVRRIRAICQSLSKSSALLRAYDISSHTPADELPERVLELINDARFAWPTDVVASHAKQVRGGHNVWRYLFDQEGPSKGVPHHAVDLLYLFDNVPLTVPASISPPSVFSPGLSPIQSPRNCSRPDTPDMSYGSDTDSDVDFGFGFNEPDGCEVDDAWGMPVVDEWTYTRVRDAVQSRWIAFAYGEAPWSTEDKLYVFGPEGEVGERSMGILAGRRRENLWKEALAPLGMPLVQKVGIELANGPAVGMR
ncbi:carboxylesterase [Irpex rosettiformis]|uniref:Carboxylesterase n=1 Tax=Irpex rosettiformis TaxID=378272 RepID=A0ACB8U448_9APHY|nr:carboxylesterase [Irpex rosettiformis]